MKTAIEQHTGQQPKPEKKRDKRGFEPRPGWVVQAFVFALDPAAQTEQRLRSHCGASRAAYNWAISHVLAVWDQRKAEASYGIAEEELTPWRAWSLPSLRKEFNAAKHTDPRFAHWWADNSKEAYNTGLAGAAAAFDAYSKSKRGERAGARMGRPNFKSKHRSRLACRFTTGAIRCEDTRRHVVLPVVGRVRTHESTRKLHRRLANGTARILSATVSHRRGRWQVSFQVEIERAVRAPARPRSVAGVDLGVKALAVVADSDGQVRHVANPRHLNGELQRLRHASRRVSRRQGPDRRTGQAPSQRWVKANIERNRVHHRVANLREDAIHQLTTSLAREYGTVVVEDLNVAGMIKNRRLARHIADAGFGRIRRQLDYKTTWNGGRMIVADRWFASSKTCSGCGAVKTKLGLHVRVFDCDECPLVLDRDVNAARNLAKLAQSMSNTGTGVAGDRGAQAPKPRGADRKTRTTRRGRTTPAGRAGGATPRTRKEAGDRRRGTQLRLW
ncbi:IS607 family element RNA-guided endonuclease TnpB [Nocardiopsis exhalans]|uniref:IS607 family element RNA-guided endonuclease TnpB n=1 Tax=Nocardiopsis exhalans TaxID=163604 RepID=A0ABY5D1S3_9ACTN|nr:IS607 family element RNA-guided endonuclease TnpB [Nocardiopsis exhalans]USY18316.1 IS607 family element RNA-guided endonuclease TnpB [Nocardiopsis exhalans]